MIQPNGGKLVDRVLKGKARDEALARAGRLPRLVIDSELVSDVENIPTGVYSPLEGFVGEADFRGVLAASRLASDIAWTVPIVLDVDRKTAEGLKMGEEIRRGAEGGPAGTASTGTGVSSNTTYVAPRMYTITLTIQDDLGNSATTTRMVDIR